MCVFCAAVPAAASVGAMATAKQKRAKRQQAERQQAERHSTGEQPQPPTTFGLLSAFPAQHVTGVVIAGIVTASVIYHAQIGPA